MEDNEDKRSAGWLIWAGYLWAMVFFLWIVAIWTGSGKLGGTGGVLCVPAIVITIVGLVHKANEEDWML